MKIRVTRNCKTKRTTVSIRAESERDKANLTDAVMSGRLIRELNKVGGKKA